MNPRERFRGSAAGRPGLRVCICLLLVAALICAHPLRATEAPQTQLSRPWYYTEVVVFQRIGVMDYANEEDLVHNGDRFPAPLESFQPEGGAYGAYYGLDGRTRLCLAYPYLDTLALAIAAPDVYAFDVDEPGVQDAAVPPPIIAPRLAADPLLDFLAAVAQFEASLDAESYRWLDPATFTLTREANRLTRTGRYQVLLHGRWLQPVPPRESPQPLLLQTGLRYGETFALEGSFDVTLGRYLHFGAQLFYREPLLGRAPLNRPLAPPLAGANGIVEVAVRPDARRYPSEQDLTASGYMLIRESRRVRSGELHYLDHPKLGVLVRIEPAALPEALSEAGVALEEREQ